MKSASCRGHPASVGGNGRVFEGGGWPAGRAREGETVSAVVWGVSGVDAFSLMAEVFEASVAAGITPLTPFIVSAPRGILCFEERKVGDPVVWGYDVGDGSLGMGVWLMPWLVYFCLFSPAPRPREGVGVWCWLPREKSGGGGGRGLGARALWGMRVAALYEGLLVREVWVGRRASRPGSTWLIRPSGLGRADRVGGQSVSRGHHAVCPGADRVRGGGVACVS